MSRLFTSGGQSTDDLASATVFPMNIHGWFPLGLHFFHTFHTYFLHAFHYLAFGSGLRYSTDFIIRSSTWLLNIVILFFNMFLMPNIFLITRYSFLFWLLLFRSSSLLWLMCVPSFQSHWSPLLMFFKLLFPAWSLFPKSTIILFVNFNISHSCDFFSSHVCWPLVVDFCLWRKIWLSTNEHFICICIDLFSWKCLPWWFCTSRWGVRTGKPYLRVVDKKSVGCGQQVRKRRTWL